MLQADRPPCCTVDVYVGSENVAVHVGGVAGVLHHQVAVGQQDGVEVEHFEGAEVQGGSVEAVTGHADEADEAFVACLDERFEGAAGAEGGNRADKSRLRA